MIAQNNEILTAATESLFEYNADDLIRQQCQARAEAERHDRTMQKILAEQNNTIAEQNNTIAEQNSTIAEQNSTIAEQNSTIAEQNSLLAEKDLRIKELEALLNKSKQ